MKSREKILDEALERAQAYIAKLKEKPTFIVKMKKNAFGRIGAILCWPDGTIVPDQVDCTVRTSVDALVTVTVTFNAGVNLIEIKECPDGEADEV
jgi:hypothetical protein